MPGATFVHMYSSLHAGTGTKLFTWQFFLPFICHVHGVMLNQQWLIYLNPKIRHTCKWQLFAYLHCLRQVKSNHNSTGMCTLVLLDNECMKKCDLSAGHVLKRKGGKTAFELFGNVWCRVGLGWARFTITAAKFKTWWQVIFDGWWRNVIAMQNQ